MRSRLTLASTVSVLAVAATIALPATADAAVPAIRITKIYYDSPGSDLGGTKSLNAEYVVIKNTTRTARSLKGWTLRDKTGFVFTFPTFTLKGGATVTVHTGTGTATATHRYYGHTGRRYVWNNTGDTAYLRDSKRVLKDSWAFKDKGSASSVSR
jgi:hypothetical protein